jgi:SAM-dependent methyltransferase
MKHQARQHNRRAWDDRARQRKPHTRPAREADFQNPLAVIDSCGWLGGNVTGKRVLCLAAGGGKHGPLFAAAGAVVTVVDLSPEMLALDRQIAKERGLQLSLIESSMDDLSLLPAANFEAVIQPVSSCYVPDILAVYREVARVTAAGGLYISQHKQPASLQADAAPTARGYLLKEPYYRAGPLPPAANSGLPREAGTVEFLHRWEELLGGLCRSGFVIEDLVEPRHAEPLAAAGSFGHRSLYLPPFVTLKARRKSERGDGERPAVIWTR